jgi:DNA-binding transcriptional MerR regulator
MTEQQVYLTTEEVATRFRRPPATVRYWRHIGYGPKGIRMGRRVVYSVAEIERFEREAAAKAGAAAATA